MYPAYKWTDSYPHHANPMHYFPNDDPRAKEIPFPMKSTLNSPYQPWAYGFNYCYPFPQEYHHHNHGCCNHGYFGGAPYSFHPHYPPPPSPSPSPFHTNGFYPPFPGTYHVPPQQYSVEQPRYDYDNPCCGCKHGEDDKKSRIESEADNDSLVPLLLKDCPYPIMWVPPRDMNTEPKETQKEKSSRELVENGEIARDQQSDHFPFPIFWFPSKKNEVGKDTNENKGLPDENKRETRINDDSEAKSGKHAIQKVIPVKQDEEKKNLKGKSDSLGNGTDRKASPKTSKLPPVCLRIDPLPRRKNTSCSPSPPAPADKQVSPVDSPKCSQQHSQLSQGLKKNTEEQSKGNIKTIEVTNKIEKDRLADHVPRGERNESQSGVVQDQSSKGQVEEMKNKNLSEHEAALIIQSVYHGFQVRKSQPLMKLRQISQVRKQVEELRNRIQELESSSTTSVGVGDKQKLIIGETIMSLLLKLDTIQGLHPIVRDVRKSVAKELVGLQEKLDSVRSETSVEETMSSTKQSEDDAIQAHSDNNVKLVESSSGLCENHQEEATKSHNTNVELQHDEKCSSELNNNQLQVSVETEQAVDDAIQEKFDQASDSINGGLEVEDIKLVEVEQNTTELNSNQLEIPMEAEQSAIQDQGQLDFDNNVGICEHNEVESEDDGVTEDRDINIEVESEDDGVTDINFEPQVESGSQLETEQPKEQDQEQDKSDEIQAQAQAQLEGDGECCEVEAIDDGNVKVEMKVELPKEDPEDLIVFVPKEEAPKADDDESSTEVPMEDVGGGDGKLMVDIGGVPPMGGGGDRKLMEENEKLRVAVEELMKAGNEQLNVINKLAGKVKDLEKKLSRKKKIKVNKCKSRGSLVQ